MGFKLKGRTMFPALVQVSAPLTLVKNGLLYTFGVDPSAGAVGPTGPGYGGTSTSSLAIATGSKSFNTQSGYAYQAGNYIRASSAADGTNYMEGTVTSYIGTSLVLNVTKVGGSGTKTDWAFSLAGTPGTAGPGSGDLLAANNGSDFSNKKTTKDNLSVHGADVASASTIDLEGASGDLVDVTGNATIGTITLNDGHERTVRFTGTLTLVQGSSLVLPGGANITTAAGDFAVFRGYAASVVRCVSYDRASGQSTSAQPLVQGRTPTSAAATFVNGSATITVLAHGLIPLAPVFFTSSGSLPTNFTAPTTSTGTVSPNTYIANPTLYYVIGSSITTNTFQVATSIANAIAGIAVVAGSAGSGTHTAYANAMIPTGYIGEYVYNEVQIGSAFALTSGSAGQVWNTLSLTAGIWELAGNTGVIKTGGTTPTYTHMHCGLVYNFSTIPTSPHNGTTAAHITSNDPNGWMFANNPEQIFLTTPTTINAVITADFTGGTCGAYGKTWARRIG